MTAVVYLRVFNSRGVRTTLVYAKTKVAPLKRLTIPRLELTAAVLLAKCARYVQTQLHLIIAPILL